MSCGSFNALSAPLRLVIDLTSKCNLRCAYCCFFSSPEEYSCVDMSVERWVALIDEAAECGVLEITLRGGEALLSPAFWPVIEAAVRDRMRFSLLTNGKLFTDEVARRIADSRRCNLVKISLDGPESIHDPVRGAGSHAAALAAIAAARRAGLPMRVTCAVHRLNWEKLPEIIAYLIDDLGLEHISFSAVTVCDDPRYALDETSFRAAVHLIGEHARPQFAKIGMYGSLLWWRGMLEGRSNERGCDLLRKQLCVFSDGRVVPCGALAGRALGYAGTDRLSDMWAALSADRELLSRRAVDPECSSCRYLSVCRGLCAGVRLNPGYREQWKLFCLRRQVDAYGSGL